MLAFDVNHDVQNRSVCGQFLGILAGVNTKSRGRHSRILSDSLNCDFKKRKNGVPVTFCLEMFNISDNVSELKYNHNAVL